MQGAFGRAAVFFAGSCAISAALKKRQSFFFDSLSKSEFVVAAKDRKLGHAAIGYSRMTDAGIGDILGAGFMGTLEPQKSGCIKIYAIVPSDWEQIGIQYTPRFAQNETRSFVLNRANKL